MESSKINASKIKAAGSNFSIIGYTMIAGIIITLFQVSIAANADMRSRGDLESIKAANYLFMLLYIVCTFIIIGNLISAGSELSSCDEEFDNINIDSETLLSNLNLNSSRTGELGKGGIIVHLDNNNEHGLVCSKDDLGLVNWHDAKKICEGFNEGGYSDWRLPNKDELQLIYSLCPHLLRNRTFVKYYYFSSTENGNDKVYLQSFFDGLPSNFHSKNDRRNVLAVRSF